MTVRVNTAELEGAALDWAVAKVDLMCEGLEWSRADKGSLWLGFADIDGERTACAYLPLSANLIEQRKRVDREAQRYSPSTDWEQGGPLISEYKAEFRVRGDSYECRIEMWDYEGIGYDEIKMMGVDHLTAACRAVVAAKLGGTVEVPKELA